MASPCLARKPVSNLATDTVVCLERGHRHTVVVIVDTVLQLTQKSNILNVYNNNRSILGNINYAYVWTLIASHSRKRMRIPILSKLLTVMIDVVQEKNMKEP